MEPNIEIQNVSLLFSVLVVNCFSSVFVCWQIEESQGETRSNLIETSPGTKTRVLNMVFTDPENIKKSFSELQLLD